MRDVRDASSTTPAQRSQAPRPMTLPPHPQPTDDGGVSPAGLVVAAGLIGGAAAFSAHAVDQLDGAPRRPERIPPPATERVGSPISDAIMVRPATMADQEPEAFIGPVLDPATVPHVIQPSAVSVSSAGQGAPAQREVADAPADLTSSPQSSAADLVAAAGADVSPAATPAVSQAMGGAVVLGGKSDGSYPQVDEQAAATEEEFTELQFTEGGPPAAEEQELSFSEDAPPVEDQELSFTEEEAAVTESEAAAAAEPVEDTDDMPATTPSDITVEVAPVSMADDELPPADMLDELDGDEDAGLP